MIKTIQNGKASLIFASGSLLGVGCKLVQFVVYCVLFVMMSTNIEKNQLFQRRDMSWQLMSFSGHKLGQYADQALLKSSLFQNKTPDLSLKYILIQVHDQQGQH